MDKEQAIEIIETHAENISSGSLVGRALSMAIDALKAQLSMEDATKDATSDLIDRQQAIDVLHGYFDGMLDTDTVCPADIYGLFECIPSAQPEVLACVNGELVAKPEPKEGHWIEEKIYRDVIECNCSECGQLMTTAASVRMNFCPNCGAKMKGERQK